MTDIPGWIGVDDARAIRVELAEGRRRLEDQHGPLLGTRFDQGGERLEEYYADGFTFARPITSAAAEIAFETH